VLLIHDAETDKGSCAMDVGVGSFFDGDVEGKATAAIRRPFVCMWHQVKWYQPIVQTRHKV
jgi:hypothetical protein